MEITPDKIGDVDGVALATAKAEVFVSTSRGPRILKLNKPSGRNFMFQSLDGGPLLGSWENDGGDRTWPHHGFFADENPRSYAHDNKRCKLKRLPNNSGVEVWSGVNKQHAIQTGYRITASRMGGFKVVHLIKNCDPHGLLMNVGSWGISAVDLDCCIGILTRNEASNWRSAGFRIVYDWAGHKTEPEFLSKQLTLARDCLTVKPLHYEGKIMAQADLGAIVVAGPDAAFLKVVRYDPRLEQLHPRGCNLAIYTCDKFAESETMGPVMRLEAGQVLEHEELWYVTEDAMNFRDDLEELYVLAAQIMEG